MRYWLFNLAKFKIGEAETEVVSWNQRRRFGGLKDDKVIFFQLNSNLKYFSSLYTITEVTNKPTSGDEDTRRFDITVALQKEQDFGKNKPMLDYVFSFPRVRYFDKYLYRHFFLRYYVLSRQEFEAIVEDDIFESRTILGTALNSMHIDHRRAFSELLVSRFPEVLQNKYNHAEVLTLFKEYFEYAVLKPAKQLQDSMESLRSFLGPNPVNEISFGVQNEQDNISIQVGMITEFLQSYEGNVIFEQYRFKESKFDRIFQNRPLPIEVNE